MMLAFKNSVIQRLSKSEDDFLKDVEETEEEMCRVQKLKETSDVSFLNDSFILNESLM